MSYASKAPVIIGLMGPTLSIRAMKTYWTEPDKKLFIKGIEEEGENWAEIAETVDKSEDEVTAFVEDILVSAGRQYCSALKQVLSKESAVDQHNKVGRFFSRVMDGTFQQDVVLMLRGGEVNLACAGARPTRVASTTAAISARNGTKKRAASAKGKRGRPSKKRVAQTGGNGLSKDEGSSVMEGDDVNQEVKRSKLEGNETEVGSSSQDKAAEGGATAATAITLKPLTTGRPSPSSTKPIMIQDYWGVIQIGEEFWARLKLHGNGNNKNYSKFGPYKTSHEAAVAHDEISKANGINSYLNFKTPTTAAASAAAARVTTTTEMEVDTVTDEAGVYNEGEDEEHGQQDDKSKGDVEENDDDEGDDEDQADDWEVAAGEEHDEEESDNDSDAADEGEEIKTTAATTTVTTDKAKKSADDDDEETTDEES